MARREAPRGSPCRSGTGERPSSADVGFCTPLRPDLPLTGRASGGAVGGLGRAACPKALLPRFRACGPWAAPSVRPPGRPAARPPGRRTLRSHPARVGAPMSRRWPGRSVTPASGVPTLMCSRPALPGPQSAGGVGGGGLTLGADSIGCRNTGGQLGVVRMREKIT
jgi:hypothetical protein